MVPFLVPLYGVTDTVTRVPSAAVVCAVHDGVVTLADSRVTPAALSRTAYRVAFVAGDQVAAMA